jgi:WD40 repeat protein
MSLNIDGRLLATASEKGEVIRLTNTESGQAIQEFRRGSDKADIYSLTFDVRTNWLAISSNRPTVHVFAVDNDVTD